MTYIPGDAWFVCDRCGFKYRRSTMRREWSGQLVCESDWDPRPAYLDPPDIYPEGLPLSDARPEPDAVEVEANDVTREDL